MRNAPLLALIAAGVGLASLCPCFAHACDDAHPDRESIVGRWNWIQSLSPLDGEFDTPETLGFTQVYTFREDGTYECMFTYASGEVSSEGTWCLRECDGEGSFIPWCGGQTILYLDAGPEFPSELGSQLEYSLCEASCGYYPVEIGHGRALVISNTGIVDAEIRIFEWDPGVSSAVGSWGSVKARYLGP